MINWINSKSTQRRFWSKVNIIQDANSCWLWTGALHPSGYGAFRIGFSSAMNASRACYILTRGEPNFSVLHKCDIKPCVRPSHLYDGTPAQNSEDMARRSSIHRVLTGKIVIEARIRFANGERFIDIATNLNVNPHVLRKAIIRENWAWLC